MNGSQEGTGMFDGDTSQLRTDFSPLVVNGSQQGTGMLDGDTSQLTTEIFPH